MLFCLNREFVYFNISCTAAVATATATAAAAASLEKET